MAPRGDAGEEDEEKIETETDKITDRLNASLRNISY